MKASIGWRTSCQLESAGSSQTAARMEAAGTSFTAGWDLAGEPKNGTEDLWWILEGKDYPRLWWEAGKK
jgi:hypothetical protein